MTIFDTPEWKESEERLRREHFEHAVTNRNRWMLTAARLRYAADVLFDTYFHAKTRDRERLEARFASKTAAGSRVLEGQELVDSWSGQLLVEYYLLMGGE